MNLQENLEQIRKNSEQMSWSGCGNCSRRKFYQIGYEAGAKQSERELEELRNYKNKVKKFISKNEPIVLKLPMQLIIEKLKKELE